MVLEYMMTVLHVLYYVLVDLELATGRERVRVVLVPLLRRNS